MDISLLTDATARNQKVTIEIRVRRVVIRMTGEPRQVSVVWSKGTFIFFLSITIVVSQVISKEEPKHMY